MTHVVTDLRADLRAALALALPAVTWAKDWWRSVDRGALPRAVVVTPRVDVSRFDDETIDRLTHVHVILKRAGGEDLEDDLYQDAAAIEVAAIPVLSAASHDFDLDSIEVEPDGDATDGVGVLRMVFSLRLLTLEAEPEALILPD